MSAPQSPAQARVIDPVLSQVARGYRHAPHIWSELFPVVPVAQRGGKVIKYGTEDFRKRNLERAPGAKTQRIQYGYSSDSYSLSQRSLEGVVPIENLEDAAAVPSINLGLVAVRKTLYAVSLQIEVEAAAQATKSSNYATDHTAELSSSSQWSHADSNPLEEIEKRKEVIASSIGLEPNLLVCGPKAWRALRTHAKVRQEVYHTMAAQSITPEQLSSVLNIERVVVGWARSQTSSSDDFSALWGNHALLAYSNTGTHADMGEPSFGYTYRLNGYPVSEQPYSDRACKSWIFPVTTEDTPVVVGADAGYLWRAVAA